MCLLLFILNMFISFFLFTQTFLIYFIYLLLFKLTEKDHRLCEETLLYKNAKEDSKSNKKSELIKVTKKESPGITFKKEESYYYYYYYYHYYYYYYKTSAIGIRRSLKKLISYLLIR
jgi:predicted membrane protein